MNIWSFLNVHLFPCFLLVFNAAKLTFPLTPASPNALNANSCLSNNTNCFFLNNNKIIRTKRAHFLSPRKGFRYQEEMRIFANFSFQNYDKTLSKMLLNLTFQELKECSISIVYDQNFENSVTLQSLLALPNVKQVN